MKHFALRHVHYKTLYKRVNNPSKNILFLSKVESPH
nr:MAG TPA: hypothetical protein [Caudoviricetes sp.]